MTRLLPSPRTEGAAEISCTLGVDRRTIRRWARACGFPERKEVRRKNAIDQYRPTWINGGTKAVVMLRICGARFAIEALVEPAAAYGSGCSNTTIVRYARIASHSPETAAEDLSLRLITVALSGMRRDFPR